MTRLRRNDIRNMWPFFVLVGRVLHLAKEWHPLALQDLIIRSSQVNALYSSSATVFSLPGSHSTEKTMTRRFLFSLVAPSFSWSSLALVPFPEFVTGSQQPSCPCSSLILFLLLLLLLLLLLFELLFSFFSSFFYLSALPLRVILQ